MEQIFRSDKSSDKDLPDWENIRTQDFIVEASVGTWDKDDRLYQILREFTHISERWNSICFKPYRFVVSQESKAFVQYSNFSRGRFDTSFYESSSLPCSGSKESVASSFIHSVIRQTDRAFFRGNCPSLFLTDLK